MKRKDFENAYDDFSCFSVAACARKARRLDCELPPVIEEEIDSGFPLVSDQSFLDDNSSSGVLLVQNEVPSNQELAIVLYNPASAATQGMVKSPTSSNFSLVMNADFFSDWRSNMLHQGSQSKISITELDESDENNGFQSNNSMAVVPWVASQQPPYEAAPGSQPAVTVLEPMEADADCEMMETDDHSGLPGYTTQGCMMNNGMVGGVAQTALPLQQPHCLMPQYSPNTYTPINW